MRPAIITFLLCLFPMCLLADDLDDGEAALNARDYKEAFKHFRVAAENDLASPQKKLDVVGKKIQETPSEDKEALKRHIKAAELGDIEAQLWLFQRSMRNCNYKEASQWLQNGVEHGDARAQTCLGILYMYGFGVNKDRKEGFKLYLKAVAQDAAIAKYFLGFLYENGEEGIPQDYKEAVKWYREAAEQGYVDAQERLGLMYECGHGVSEDRIQAHMWCNLAGRDISRNRISATMTKTQIEQAQDMAREKASEIEKRKAAGGK
ncbi:MAG: sel1 repeat family protein [Candidatus Riflebacteria bacterium]|nr:sel1 repeat family protein [Candidatus Riflebacteria bacterium]